MANNSEDSKGAVVGKCRKGFTTIELMIAIAILVLLMGIVLVGFGALGNHGKATDTKVAIEAAKSMLAEVEAAGAMTRVKDLFQGGFNQDFYGKLGIMAPDFGVLTTSADRDRVIQSKVIYAVPGKSSGSTANVMRQLYSLPNNRKIVELLPVSRTAKVLLKPADPKSESVVVLLDGWGNPIIFVPAAGMRGFKDLKDNLQTVTSVGILNYQTIQSSGLPGTARPFFVSAGPDGDFTTHQDNIYSFEN